MKPGISNFHPSDEEQLRVLTSTAPLTVVVGGAGSGKTTCASAAARAHLERIGAGSKERVLFLSFSRSSVTRIAGRARGILGCYSDQVDVTTFHALAWSIIRRFGSAVGLSGPELISPAASLFAHDGDALEYKHLLPSALSIIEMAPAVAAHLASRWSLIIVDEYQDTDDLQEQLLTLISPHSRLMLLGDANQCIYASFRRADGVYAERLEEACARAGAGNTIRLKEASHRDPSGVIPALAMAIMRRDFESTAFDTAIGQGRLSIHPGVIPSEEARQVAERVTLLTAEGLSVSVFSHHNDMLALLSDALKAKEIAHEISGLSDSLSAALLAQVRMLGFATGQCDWTSVKKAMAIFVSSAVKGGKMPPLARQILDGSAASPLTGRLISLRNELSEASIANALVIAADAHLMLGLPNKSSSWAQGSKFLRPIYARSVRTLGRAGANQPALFDLIALEARETSHELLTDTVDDPQDVQLMNLHQTKGKEADATIVVLRETDFFGYETEPYLELSRLLYVVFSRARHKIVVLLVGSRQRPAIAPLAHLALRVPLSQA